MNIVHQIFRRVRTNFPRTITLGPHRVKLPAGHLLDWNRLRHRRYDEPLAEISALLAAKYPGMCAIDIGANVGDTAAMMVISPDISVLCVEGNPAYVPLLIENLSRISPSSEVEENYVGFEDTDVSASVETAAGTASIVISGQAEPGQAPLRLRRLESILIDHPRFQDARLIKIDTDGFDAKIVMAASLAIRRMRPVLLVEYSPVGPVEVERECRAMIDCLCEIGYVHFHIFDNFGNHMLRLSEADTHQMRALNAYVRSSRQDLRPAIFYYDICTLTPDDTDVSDALLQGYVGLPGSDAPEPVARSRY